MLYDYFCNLISEGLELEPNPVQLLECAEFVSSEDNGGVKIDFQCGGIVSKVIPLRGQSKVLFSAVR